MSFKEFAPSELPPITAVEIVVVKHIDVDRMSQLMQAAKNLDGVRVTGDTAQSIASLWRKLPDGEPLRCHVPTYGLRFFSESKMVCQASVCWKCNTLYGDANDTEFSFFFEGSVEVSQQLLVAVKAVAGTVPHGE